MTEPLSYLVRRTKPKVSDLWDSAGTLRVMASASGLHPSRYRIVKSADQLRIGTTCASVRK